MLKWLISLGSVFCLSLVVYLGNVHAQDQVGPPVGDAPEALTTDPATKAPKTERIEDLEAYKKKLYEDLEAHKKKLYQEPIAQEVPKEFTAGDWVLGGLSGAGFGIAGTIAGGYIGYQLAGGCEKDEDDTSFLGNCFLHGLGEMVIGGTVGFAVGGPLGIYLYGQGRGFNGRYWPTAGGYLVGVLAGGLLAGASGSEALIVLPVLFAQIGGVWAYKSSITSGPPESPRSGALLDLSPDEGLRLSIPAVSWTRRQKEERISVQLLGGYF